MKRELNIWQAIICLVLLASMIICLVACQNQGGEQKPALAATAIEHETKFGNVYI